MSVRLIHQTSDNKPIEFKNLSLPSWKTVRAGLADFGFGAGVEQR